MRWEVDGEIWDSKFEYEVFSGLRAQGVPVRRTGPQDSLSYQVAVRNGACAACGSESVVTRHTYTPDIYSGEEGQQLRRDGQPYTVPATGYYIEAKGFLRADRRALIRSFRKARPDVALRLVVQRDYVVSKKSGLTIVGWIKRYLKCPVAVWTGGRLEWQ